MNTRECGRRVSAQRMVYLCTCATLSALVFGIFVCKPGINWYNRATFADMIHGTAHKPYVCRVLLPTTVRLIASAVPPGVKASLDRSVGSSAAIENLFTILGWEQQYLVEYFVALVLMYLSLWGFLWALRYLLGGVYQVSTTVRDVFTLVALLGLTQFFRYFSYLYDFPTLLLFTLGLALMVRARWKLFLLVYLLACLNKETTILLTMIFFIHFLKSARMPRTLFAGLLLTQLAIFGLVRLGLFVVFRDNPGGFLPAGFPHHNLDVLRAYPLATVFGWCGVAVLMFHGWSAKPAILRHGVWIVVPLVVSAFFLGYVDELRDYYEAYPIMLLLLLPSVGRLWGFDVISANQQPAPAAGQHRAAARAGRRTRPG